MKRNRNSANATTLESLVLASEDFDEFCFLQAFVPCGSCLLMLTCIIKREKRKKAMSYQILAIRKPFLRFCCTRKQSKMEYCPASFSAIGQLYPERISDNRSGIWHMLNRSVHRSEVICPEPRPMSRAPFISDGCNRLFSKTKSVLPLHSGERESLGILDIILCRDDPEGEYESPNQMGFFCGSPPVRTSNPVIHDAEFEKETAVEASLGNPLRGNLTLARVAKAASASSPLINSYGLEPSASRVDRAAAPEPLGNFHGGKPMAVKMERASPSCGSSVGGKPKVRIEGFASGNSDSNCIVPALA